MLKYKVNVLKALKDKGYSQNSFRESKLIGQAMLTKIRHGELPSFSVLDTLCNLLECQPGDIIEYVPECTSSDQVNAR